MLALRATRTALSAVLLLLTILPCESVRSLPISQNPAVVQGNARAVPSQVAPEVQDGQPGDMGASFVQVGAESSSASGYEDFDGIKWYKTMSIQTKGGLTHMVLSRIFLAAGISFIVYVVYLVVSSDAATQRDSVREAMDSMLIVWVGIAGLCSAIICASIYRGQGLRVRRFDAGNMEFTRTNKYEFKHDEYFAPAVVVGGVCVILAVLTLVWRKMSAPGPAAQVRAINEPNARGPRIHELDYLKYYQIICIVTFAHFLQFAETGNAGINISPFLNTLDILGWTHWIVGFVVISGYNAPVRNKDLIPRRAQRVFSILFTYLWCMLLYLMFFYFVMTPMVQGTNSKGQAETILSQNNDFTIDHDNEAASTYESRLTSELFFTHLFGKPAYVLWYLESLFAWCLIIPLWMRLRAPITLAIAVSVLGMYFQPYVGVMPLDYSLTLEMFPYFVIGASVKYNRYDRELYRIAKNRYSKYAAAALLCLILAFATRCPFYVRGEWHMYLPSFGAMRAKAHDAQWWYSIGVVGLIFTNSATVLATVCLAPTGPSYVTRAAAFSLVPYMLHYMFVLLLAGLGYYNDGFPVRFDSGYMWLTMTISVGLCVVFMHPPFGSRLMYLIRPPFFKWCYAQDESAPPAARGAPGADKEGAIARGSKFENVPLLPRYPDANIDSKTL